MDAKILKIATHNKTFHADEVTAIALLKIFVNKNIKVSRLDHETTDFNAFDMVVDIGRKFDNKKYFDHHQYKGGKSSAGLIWGYLGLEKEYPKISKLIKLVDDNDVGIAKAKPFEYSSLIKCFNCRDIYSKEQDEQFEKAVEFATDILNSMIDMQEQIKEAEKIVRDSFMFDNNPNIIELSSFTPHWGSFINAQTTPHIKAVVWEDEHEKNWKVKIPSKSVGSFELNAKSFKPDNSMIFVHSAGHFAIAKDEQTMKDFLKKQIKNSKMDRI